MTDLAKLSAAELLPCPNPWCASHDTSDPELFTAHRPIVEHSRSGFELRVSCPVCPISGPWAASNMEAWSAWNTRTGQLVERDAVAGVMEALEEVAACMLNGGDGVTGDFGWNISRLTKARPMIRAALTAIKGGDDAN